MSNFIREALTLQNFKIILRLAIHLVGRMMKWLPEIKDNQNMWSF